MLESDGDEAPEDAMTARTVRIGGASGFWGDSSMAAPQLVRHGRLDYLVFDYLAEVTMSILAAQKARQADAGYARDFVDVTMRQLVREIAGQRIRVVSNAGGVNPLACRDALLAVAREAGVSLKDGVVLGDDLIGVAAGYDKVIIDLGAGVERTVRQLTHSAATCLVLVTDEPTSLTDAYAFIKITNAERPGNDIRVVANMVNSNKEGERTYNTLLKACQGFLKISPPLLGIVRRDNRVREAIRSQTSILTRYPNSEAASDIEAIAERLIE